MQPKKFKLFFYLYLMNDVFIGKGNIFGKRVFASRNFQKGEMVIKYNEDFEKPTKSSKNRFENSQNK